MPEDFDSTLQSGSARFAEATLPPPAASIRERAGRRRRRHEVVAGVMAVAAVAAVGGTVALGGVGHRSAPQMAPTVNGSAPDLLKSPGIDQESTIAVRAGDTSRTVFAELTKKRGWTTAQLAAVVSDNQIGLPDWAKVDGKWSVEGFLEPGDYPIAGTDDAVTVLRTMVERRLDSLRSIDFMNLSTKLTCGTTQCGPEKALTIASIAEKEVRTPGEAQAMSEVIVNRLQAHDWLDADSTTVYGLGLENLPARTPLTAAQTRDPDDPYSSGPGGGTRGLPPGPISIPSTATLRAVLSPTSEHWYYWCEQDGGAIVSFAPKSPSGQQSQGIAGCTNS